MWCGPRKNYPGLISSFSFVFQKASKFYHWDLFFKFHLFLLSYLKFLKAHLFITTCPVTTLFFTGYLKTNVKIKNWLFYITFFPKKILDLLEHFSRKQKIKYTSKLDWWKYHWDTKINKCYCYLKLNIEMPSDKLKIFKDKKNSVTLTIVENKQKKLNFHVLNISKKWEF